MLITDVDTQGSELQKQITSEEEPQVLLLISECTAPTRNKSVDLICSVLGEKPLEITIESKAKHKTERTFDFRLSSGKHMVIRQLSTWTSELGGNPICTMRGQFNKNITKTLRLPASSITEEQNAQSSQKTTPPPQAEEPFPEATKAADLQTDTVEAIAPRNLSVNFLVTPTHPEMSSWLLCEVSGFFPHHIHLTWRSQSEINPSYFATAQPIPQPGGNTYQTWSVLRTPVTLKSSPDTYTCVVEHGASRTKLNASKSLDVSGTVNTIPNVCFRDEQNDSYVDLEDNGLWPTLCTFVALFLLTLLYSGFITFMKVK